MAFNSLLFAAFFALFLLIYYGVPAKWQSGALLTGSALFCASFSPGALIVTGLIILLFYKGGQLVDSLSGKMQSLVTGSLVILIIGLLAGFRFLSTAGSNLSGTPVIGGSGGIFLPGWFIPVGISYMTFSGISYLLDVRRRKIAAEAELLPFLSFFLYFPKLVMGPIERPANGLGWFRSYHAPDYANLTDGLKLVAWGLFKKVVIADRLASVVFNAYASPGDFGGIPLLIATMAFAIQVYADFSGYTDMALGFSSMLGIRLSQNFNRPYFAHGFRDFWRRWHITLSEFLRDYIFLPLAYRISGQMKKERYLGMRTDQWVYIMATMITFALCGLWHGLAWTFLVWGLLFGLYLSAEMLMTPWRKKINKRLNLKNNRIPATLIFSLPALLLILLAWVFFRASSLTDAWIILRAFTHIPSEVSETIRHAGVLKGMMSGLGVTFNEMIVNIVLILFLFAVEGFMHDRSWNEPLDRLPGKVRWTMYYLVLILIFFFGAFNSHQDFIYAQF